MPHSYALIYFHKCVQVANLENIQFLGFEKSEY